MFKFTAIFLSVLVLPCLMVPNIVDIAEELKAAEIDLNPPKLLASCASDSQCQVGQYCLRWSVDKCTDRKPSRSLCFSDTECESENCHLNFCDVAPPEMQIIID